MASQEFNDKLNIFFGASGGAGSKVTDREFEDSQITITGPERNLFLDNIQEIPRGSITTLETRGINCSFPFRVYPTGKLIFLNVNHPKSTGNELRLYLQTNLFKPAAGLFWFVFKKENELWIGALHAFLVNSIEIGSTHEPKQHALFDIADTMYQTTLDQEFTPKYVERTIKQLGRDPRVARTALEKANYKCEMLPDFETFVSRTTGTPYMEAHHLIPISLQPLFEQKLDVIENICSLNPFSHRMVHHAKFSEIKEHLVRLSANRKKYLSGIGMNTDKVLAIYNGEDA